MRVTLYSKPGCLLCDELKTLLQELQSEVEFVLTERNIEDDADDFARYRYLIPVLDIEGDVLLYPPHTWDSVRTAFLAARRQADR